MRVGVIGGGVFGSEVAYQLKSAGHEVVLYEMRERLLDGATANSQNRLHLGLHYPRDLQTAIQSRIGFNHFKERFPETIRMNFPNYYAIAKAESKVSKDEFEIFASSAQIVITPVDLRDISNLGIEVSYLSKAWICDEGVIDIDLLRNLLHHQLYQAGVEVHLNRTVKECNLKGSCWLISDSEGETKSFDFIVRATYGTDLIESNYAKVHQRQYEYHRTLIAILDSSSPTFGITIIDGDFLTILPDGFSSRFLAYSPSISVRASSQGARPPLSFFQDDSEDQNRGLVELEARVRHWAPKWVFSRNARHQLSTIRSIDPNVRTTDRRTSVIVPLGPNFLDIWSGKIDHCVEIAETITRRITQ